MHCPIFLFLFFSLVCSTALHRAIFSKNKHVFKVLLEVQDLNLELQNNEGYTVLGLALQTSPPGGSFTPDSFAGQLLKRGSSLNAVNGETGDRNCGWLI